MVKFLNQMLNILLPDTIIYKDDIDMSDYDFTKNHIITCEEIDI